jgi:hypothetical protein
MKKIKEAFNIIINNPVPLLGIALAFSVLELGLFKMLTPYISTGSLSGVFSSGALGLALVLVLYWLIRIIFLTGFIPMILASVFVSDKDAVTKKIPIQFFKQNLNKKNLFNMLGLELIVVPIMLVGIILLVVPGVFWFIITAFSYFILVSSKGSSGFDAVSKSIELTKGIRLKILAYLAIYAAISFLGSITPMILSMLVETFIKAMLYVILALIYKERLEKNV